ncbi:MAG: two-component sensor histidine kinase [Betaproteobacteria bacterium]|nr:two-component sensor histidine kinase [Betaproteobacteria bacterium]
MSNWLARDRRRPEAESFAPTTPRDCVRRFNLLRWISILGLVAIIAISTVFAAILSHFMTHEILDNDASLTGQFIASVAETQVIQANLGPNVTLGQLLDERANFAKLGVDPQVAREVRSQFYDHLRFLPDVLLADVFALDRKIIWSTNPNLVGSTAQDDLDDLDRAFASRVVMTANRAGSNHTRAELQFARQPEKLYVENYVPLYDPRGAVIAVAKIYKEPAGLLGTIHRGKVLVWTCTAFAAIFIYLALFGIIRRADITLNAQQRRLVEAEALCVIGEMSAAVAHGIRNPLASIRSSAELALDGDLQSVRKNATDIIFQIDRLGKWVRELLVFSRPLSGENGNIDVVAVVEECLLSFSTQLENRRVSCQFERPSQSIPPVIGNRALATQALANIISNAIEAMPKGGSLRLEFELAALPRSVRLVVADSGPGISPSQLDLVFKPYFTTKRNGLGLGMSLARRIMERFGGAISLQSREGAGTQVRLAFKVA